MVRYVVWNFPAKKGKILVTFFSRWEELLDFFLSPFYFVKGRSCGARSTTTLLEGWQRMHAIRCGTEKAKDQEIGSVRCLKGTRLGQTLLCRCCGIVVEHSSGSSGGRTRGDDSRGSRRGGENFIFYEFPLSLVAWERGRHSSSCRLLPVAPQTDARSSPQDPSNE